MNLKYHIFVLTTISMFDALIHDFCL